MAWTNVKKLTRGWLLVAGCLPLVMLTGCPTEHAASPGSAVPQSMAPVLRNSSANSTKASTPVDLSALKGNDAAVSNYKIQQLISQAEKAYRSGVENYRAGRLDAARLDFDAAVDTMLTSGIDLKGDVQLSDEFTHLLDAVNSLEMSALKQGNGFSPMLEAAPLDAANEVTFPPNEALTAKVTAELKTTESDFPLAVNDYVAGFISYFSNSPGGHAHLLRSLERAGKYRDMISKNLSEQGVPQDLIYLAVAESGFQPQALNARSGAGGMWQFMPTGAYGLSRNGWFDERFDPEKSSIAYAKYMKTLYNQFGDWYLAMAAYNWGPGNVQRAVMKTGYADFWELYRRNVLPEETKNYVPGIIAAIIMAKNPQQYGLDKIVLEAPVVSNTVTVDYPVDLRLVADVTGGSLQEIVALNPSLLRMTTPGDMLFDLHLPEGTKDAYAERIKEIPENKRASWRFHVVKNGESLDEIAMSLHAKASEIAMLNGLAAGRGVNVGDELIVPVASATGALHMQQYAVRKGDTLVTVADRFNVSADELRSWNHLKSNAVRVGEALNVAAPVRLAPAGRQRAKSAHSITKSSPAKSVKVANAVAKTASSSKRSTKSASRLARSNTVSSNQKTLTASTKTKSQAAR